MFSNILIVDDSKTARMMIKRCLEIIGYDEALYIEADNGIDGLEKMNQANVDLVITDLNMPGMDGKDFIEKLNSSDEYSDLKIVVISSKPSKYNVDDIYSYGVDVILKKPYSPMELADTLEQLEKERSGK
jgi:two-component system chemotaxis response regulator CheY